ncbi:HesB/YadR/YfhF family protein [Lederbergia graminis]|uniref:HesB/YadR/YfhF family protein n=1 Tax=Lederbergia graminis TaxID=735518 RepID=A0ABW0LLK6_9BACI|nr:HesB/YadR/YfhF family protein [Bacillaceae bacterium]
MQITISDNAISWFKESMKLQQGDKVKFYSQIYGSSPVQDKHALAFTKDNDPIDIAVRTEVEGIEFYVEDTDVWFFDGHDLKVDYDPDEDELKFDYVKPE